jgi:8-oxo-dGTP pyrophosphatase MutT (NUDIX family)
MIYRADSLNLTEERIRSLLAERHANPLVNPLRESISEIEPRPAAVLIPLLRIKGRWQVLYILRSVVEGDMHSGQVAFPGGALDPGETNPEQAALRETNEEIGLEANSVKLLGRLEEFVTISNYSVTPVIGSIPWPLEFRLTPSEVQRAFTIPLAWLADPDNREFRDRVAPNGKSLLVVYFKEYEKELLWGVTARITLNFLEALKLA